METPFSEAASSCAQTTSNPKSCEYDNWLSTLLARLEQVTSDVSSLHERLQLVMTNESNDPPEAGSATTLAARSPIGNHFLEAVTKVEYLQSRLRDIHERLVIP